MAAECLVMIGAAVSELGEEIDIRHKFTTANVPQAVNYGYGTIAAAATYEAVKIGQVAASLIDGVYIKSIGETIYIDPACSLASAIVKRLRLDAGETTFFRPVLSDTALSIMIICSTAEAKYEYLIVGQSS